VDDALTVKDREDLQNRGIPLEELQRQLRLFARPPRPLHLDRPCTPGDGIVILGESERARCLEAWGTARDAGRFLKFVPASGAASRMFQSLLSVAHESPVPDRARLRQRANDDVAAAATLEVLENLPRFAFHQPLLEAAAAAGLRLDADAVADVLGCLLTERGLNYAEQPKGLLAFHHGNGTPRTPFEEHLTEAALYAAGPSSCRLHFTVSPQHQPGFEALLQRLRSVYEAQTGVAYQVEFSTQKPSTDMIAVDLENQPFRQADGSLLFRPGGHGALIENLRDLDGDVVFIKNIDNVTTPAQNAPTVLWKKVLAGYLVRIQEKVFRCIEQLEDPQQSSGDLEDAVYLVREELGLDIPDTLTAAGPEDLRLYLLQLLKRPLRVCGMVRNTGEPGGGPFWVRNAQGQLSRQIVERAQTDLQSPEQQAHFDQGTHFNPVDLVCGMRDAGGKAFDLLKFIDADAVFLSHKSSAGRALKALERPGLWNGAMAGWLTLFVEVPLETFNPVKTVLDLLRPAHQPSTDR